MDRKRYQRIREVLHEVSLKRAGDRESFLDEACGDDHELRREVLSLLDSVGPGTNELVPPPAAPAVPQALGQYRVEEEIGRGGMGAVYAGTDTLSGRRVAIKVVYPHAAGPRFEREARLGAAIHHDNVVRTLDVGQDGGRHYLVMEFVDGRHLRELKSALGTVPETLLREICKQVAAGLAAIHEGGIVHRDIKPENLIITGDERVRIMDLGVAKLHEASAALTRDGQFVGSLHYASPEQCDNKAIGSASDLYSLGIVMHELATGRLPFEGEPSAVLRAHLHKAPPAVADVSPFFAHLVATLLRKKPEERFRSSMQLFAVLVEGEDSAWWRDRERSVRQELPAIPVRRDTALFGRSNELKALHDAWERGGAVVLQGEAGLGKSRLVDSFLRSLTGQDIHVLYGSFPPTGGLGGVTDAIDAKFGHDTVAPGLSPAAFRAECTRLLRQLADEKPTVWVVEDLHFAPEMGRNVATDLARAAEGRPALVLLTSRTEVPDLPRIELAHLDVEAVVGMVGSEDMGRRIARKADGVPFFVLELKHALDDGGALDEVPSAVRDLIIARLGQIERNERVILDVSAVQGYEFDADLVAAAIERPVVSVLQDLAELERSSGVVRSAGRRYRFDHHQIQEVLYADLHERLREEYHTRLADAAGEDEPWFFAYHHLFGVRPEDGVRHLGEALDHLRKRFRYEEVVGLADRALAHLSGEARVPTLLKLANSYNVLGRRDAQLAAIEEAVALAPDHSKALHALATYYFLVGKAEESIRYARRAIETATTPHDEAHARAGIGTTLVRLGRTDEARVEIERAREIAIEIGNKRVEAAATGQLGAIHANQNDYGRALELHTRFRDLTVESGERRDQAYAESSIGLVHWYMGRHDEAYEHHAKALDLACEVGDRRVEQIALCNLGLALRDKGWLEQGLIMFRRMLEIAVEIEDPKAESIARVNVAFMDAILGRREEAVATYMLAAEQARGLGLKYIEGHATLNAAQLRDDVDMAREALALFSEAKDRDGYAESKLVIGRLTGEEACFREAAAIADDIDVPSHRLIARAYLGAPLLAEDEARAAHHQRMEAAFILWKKTGDATRLAEARGLLQEMRAHAPRADRDLLIANVPLHREISTSE